MQVRPLFSVERSTIWSWDLALGPTLSYHPFAVQLQDQIRSATICMQGTGNKRHDIPLNCISNQKCCRGRLKLIVTDISARRQVYIDDFQTKEELIDANMCSVHVPLFLDWQPFARYR